MQEYGPPLRATGCLKLVLDTAAHAQQLVEQVGGIDIRFAQKAMPQPVFPGQELAVHRSAGVERTLILYLGSIKELGGDTGGIGQLQQRTEEHTSELQSLMRLTYA